MATPKKPADDETETKAKPAPVDLPKLKTNPAEPGEPYPTGAGRDPEADFEAAHGYRRAPPKEA